MILKILTEKNGTCINKKLNGCVCKEKSKENQCTEDELHKAN